MRILDSKFISYTLLYLIGGNRIYHSMVRHRASLIVQKHLIWFSYLKVITGESGQMFLQTKLKKYCNQLPLKDENKSDTLKNRTFMLYYSITLPN